MNYNFSKALIQKQFKSKALQNNISFVLKFGCVNSL